MHQNKNQNKNQHEPVLLNEVLHFLAPKEGETYLDLTAGYGGHALKVASRVGSLTNLTLVDRDENSIETLTKEFAGAEIRHQDFLGSSAEFIASKRQFDLILADLGVSSLHLNTGNRGFSFSISAPLDMRMDQTQKLTATTIVNKYSQDKLVDLLRRYGEEPKAAQIARLIVQHRPIRTTDELAAIVKQAWPGYRHTNPATRTFQAIRIAVNDELNQLEQALGLWLKLLSPGGRLVVISFHSLEDRLVKQAFADAVSDGYDQEFSLLTKKPITASHTEIVHNPRARSAKLRAVAKIKTKGN